MSLAARDEREEPGMKTLRLRIGNIACAALLTCFAILFLVPLLMALNTSLKTQREVWEVLKLPSALYLGNYGDAFAKISRGLWNSACIAFPATILSTIVGAMAAYPLSQLKFKGSGPIYFLILAGLYIPYTTVLIPLFFIIRGVGLYDSIPGLWLTHIAFGIPYTTLVLRNFFITIPGELKEAAAIDGCSLRSYFWKVLLPVGRIGVSACAIIQFAAIWNEFLFALTLTRTPELFPATVALQGFGSRTQILWGPLMAASLITIVPTLVVFLIFKRQFIGGLVGVYK
jgi:ABC-type glycerol-3-phosphate transport system permease component